MAFMFRLVCPPKPIVPHENLEYIAPKPSRRILSDQHVRDLIDQNYAPDESWYNFASIAGITAVLRRKYSPDITPDMVYDSLLLDPPLKISYNMDAPGCRFIKRIY